MASAESPSHGDDGPAILYLGIGGVLQPSRSTYLWVHGRDPFDHGHQPCECAPLLERLLEPWPAVQIVLTSVRPWKHGLPYVLDALGPGLAKRVRGFTFEDLTSKARFGKAQRHMCDLDYWRMSKASIVEKHRQWLQPAAWVAVDDETHGWDEGERARHVVLTPPLQGLLDADAQAKLAGLLEYQFGPPANALRRTTAGHPGQDERRQRLAALNFDPAQAQRYALAAAAHAIEQADPRPRVLVLGLEGTLFTTSDGTVVARPHLRRFLDSAADLFERIVVYPEDHEGFSALAKELRDRKAVPEWFSTVDLMAWDGKVKDLTRLGVFDLREALLVDDKSQYVVPGQSRQWIELTTFDGSARDYELQRVLELLQAAVQPPVGRN